MTSASLVAAPLAVPLGMPLVGSPVVPPVGALGAVGLLEAGGILLYIVATALLLRLAVRWARDAIEPAEGTGRSAGRPPGHDGPS